jgi:hypothetical protein
MIDEVIDEIKQSDSKVFQKKLFDLDYLQE